MSFQMAANINTLGLLLDIVGVLLLFYYGLPAEVSRKGHNYLILESVDEAERQKARHYDNMSFLALCLLVGGFALQIVSNYL